MSHHLVALGADGVNYFDPFVFVDDFQFLLQEDGCLLIGGFNNTVHEENIWGARGWMQKGQKIDRLSYTDLSKMTRSM